MRISYLLFSVLLQKKTHFVDVLLCSLVYSVVNFLRPMINGDDCVTQISDKLCEIAFLFCREYVVLKTN